MHRFLLCAVALPIAAFLGGCSAGASAMVGYTQMAVSGDIGLSTGIGGVPSTARQDIESAFGLGDEVGSPYARGQADLGFAVLTASGFLFEESGSGVLNSDFGGISASTPVDTTLDFFNAKASLTFDIGVGPVTLAPGLAVDVFDVEFTARETTLNTSESIDELLFAPLIYLRAEVELGGLTGIGEIGYLQTPEVDGAEATVLDAELMLQLELASNLGLFAGYRLLDLDGYGESGDESFDIDLQIRGWMVGGVLRF